ncbi:putative s-adenosyl-l-methionine-dependent methyltransferase [Diaporthe ampelina]|uniref:Putative s-adenosyl-l-methionine-dependent methyltransferase n=1 Tax=Diaporthe ampelina TaxID=1214573 RepID=A0A0G2HQZ4_9PEZI|nr:putative s-adenosyl-l-methionine-dependent methyltransferase [Diaporthe ampelina]
MVLASPPAARPSQPGDGDGLADAYEETHVHGVYEAIASHFSATRHKPWPFVSSFLASRPPGSVGLDIGCGNGKNMGVNRDVAMLGCDRSAALVTLARDSMCTARYRKQQQQQQGEGKLLDAEAGPAPPAPGAIIAGADAVTADSLVLPFREASADFVICIAVIHHLSTRERRVDAIRQLLRCVRRGARRGTPAGVTPQPHDVHDATGAATGAADVQGTGSSPGQVLVYVWALEQSGSRRGWAEGGEQDLLVPWVLKAPQQKEARAKGQKKQGHRQKQSEGGAAAEEAKTQHVDERRGAIGGEGGDRTSDGGQQQRQQQHCQQQHQRRQHAQDEAVAADATADPGTAENDVADGNAQQAAHTDKTFHRYYHLYTKGELEEEVVAAGGSVLNSGYERDNWWVIAG